MTQILTRVGPTSSADGTLPGIRGTRSTSQVVQQQSGKYAEAVLRGSCFVAAIPPGTGQAPGTTLGTTAMMSIVNPAASGKRLRMMGVSVGYISGTLGAGVVALVANSTGAQAAPTGGTTITPINCLITGAANASAVVRFGSTLPASPLMLEALVSLFAELATTANGMQQAFFDLDGRYVIDQTGILALEGIAAAGTSPLLTASFMWEEIALGSE